MLMLDAGPYDGHLSFPETHAQINRMPPLSKEKDKPALQWPDRNHVDGRGYRVQ